MIFTLSSSIISSDKQKQIRKKSVKGVKTIYARYVRNFFVEAGRRGGTNGHTGGFYKNRDLARTAGALGGRISRRNGKKISERERREIHKAYEELLAIHTKAKRERKAFSYA